MKILKRIYTLFSLLFFCTVSAQVGFGIEHPEADFDVNLLTQFSAMKEVTSELDLYDKMLIADKDGNIGYRNRGHDAFIYRNTLFRKMTAPQKINASLNLLPLSVQFTVPAFGKSLVEINYSVAAYNGVTGNASIVLERVENRKKTILYESIRTFTYSKEYSSSVSAMGRAISNVYYDEITNNTSKAIEVEYNVYGITTERESIYGMWSSIAGGASNFNWGRGSINVNIFDF